MQISQFMVGSLPYLLVCFLGACLSRFVFAPIPKRCEVAIEHLRLFDDPVWAYTISSYRQALTASEYAQVSYCTTHKDVDSAAQLLQRKIDPRMSIKVGDIMAVFSKQLRFLTNSLGIFVSSNSADIDLVFGAVTLLLELAANNPKHIDKLLGAFHQVSKLIPRFEAHPPNSPRLQQTLKSMYSDIIIFCMNATLFYKHTTVIFDFLSLSSKDLSIHIQRWTLRMQQHHDLVADHSLKMHRESSISSVRPSAQIETVTILPVSERMDSKYGVIPYPENTEFHGREDILLQLYSTLVKGASPSGMPHKQRSVALCGMGGVGKTQIALKYLYTYYNSYTAIFWVNADTVEKLNEGFSEIARALELPVTKLSEKTEITELVRDVKRWLRQTDAKWLMIFDNADDLTALRDYLPEMKGHIIITSRNRTAGRPLGSQRIEVSPLSTSEGTELFHFLLSRKTSNTSTSEIQDAGDPIAAEKLVKEMGALPLAIAQATGYISRTGVSISGYLDTYKKQGDDLSKLEFGDDLDAFYERTVATTLELSVLHIQKQSIEATYLLNILSLLDPDNIPDTLFTEGGRAFQNSDSFLAFLSDKIQYNNASGTLVQFSLIDRRNGVMAMHRLLQKVVVRRMKLEDKLEIFDNTVRLVAKVFPATDTSSLWGFWDDARLYLPHCVKMQGHYNNFANHSTLQELAALFVECGKYLRERGVCSESIPMLSIARDISQKVYGWGSIQYATCCYALGRAHLEEMHLEKAIENFRTAAQTQETLLGPEARKTADSYNDWGIALHEDGQLDEAEQRYTHRLRIYEKLLGPDDPYTASSYNNLAMVALARNDPQAAVSLTRRSLRIQIRNFGENHPYIPKTRNYLAYGLRAIGKLEEAAELHRKAMVYQEANKGPRHINTATSVQGLANVLHDQGFLDEATALYFRVVDIRADALRLYHPDRVVAYKNLIILLCKQDQADEAEAVLRGIKPLIQADTTQSEQTSMNLTIDLSDIITLAYADPEGFRKRPLEVNYVKHQH